MISKTKPFIKQYWLLYFAVFVIVLTIKYLYSKAATNDLQWILAPTARWVGILSGIAFEREAGVGYINHDFRFIIASSCSGVQFMTITSVMLIYSFVHRMRTMKRGLCWTASCFGFSYLFTIFVNGFRIVLSIYLPLYLSCQDIYSGWLTPEKLHTIIGTAVYFSSLLIIHPIAGYVSARISKRGMLNICHEKDKSHAKIISGRMPPILCYFSITLGIPLLTKAYKNNGEKFMEFAMLITAVCLAAMLLFCLMSFFRRTIIKLKNDFTLKKKSKSAIIETQ